jgi:DNA-binding CsgD family transcriptional regulator
VSGTWIKTLLDFVKWSQGQQPLGPALDGLARYLDASAICLARRDRTKPAIRVLQTVDYNKDPRKPQLRQSFAHEVLGVHLDSLKEGVALLQSETLSAHGQCDPVLDHWMLRRGVTDIAFLCIGSHNGIRDIIEIHFITAVTRNWRSDSALIVKSLTEVHAGRRPGLIEQQFLDRSQGEKGALEDGPLLAPENSAGLTRTEYRLCLLIANGLSRSGAAREMRVTENTIRTHLRNIYAKTGHQTFHDLARRLVGAAEQRALGFAVSERAA